MPLTLEHITSLLAKKPGDVEPELLDDFLDMFQEDYEQGDDYIRENAEWLWNEWLAVKSLLL